MGRDIRRRTGNGGLPVVKHKTFKFLEWLFEGDTLSPAIAVFIYNLVWFVPVLKHNVDSGIDEKVWMFLGWSPNWMWATVFILLAAYQVVCCRIMRCIWWTRILTSLVVSAFVIYTTVAPAYAIWIKTGTFPEYFAGAAVVVFACVLLVARNLQREEDDGERSA